MVHFLTTADRTSNPIQLMFYFYIVSHPNGASRWILALKLLCIITHAKLLDELKETRRYWKLKEEAQDRTLWRTQFGRGY
jgi:hypothetical protein